ncbi:hypothetical protein [Sphingobium phenoxybenzoativorans]|uniref:hypothetical protein n=1 Tax=Sphingobium phenoxybenzoativorans TaxID=1592790 RepID=UPI001112FC3A|nr:hypothetical protein [Sphingobium phenoxybenzoativorans]
MFLDGKSIAILIARAAPRAKVRSAQASGRRHGDRHQPRGWRSQTNNHDLDPGGSYTVDKTFDGGGRVVASVGKTTTMLVVCTEEPFGYVRYDAQFRKARDLKVDLYRFCAGHLFHYTTLASNASGLMPPRYGCRRRVL